MSSRFAEFSLFNKKHSIIIPLLFFVINFVTKILFITSRDIAMDEPFSIFYAQMDIPGIIDMLYNENNPPFHFFFLHYWIKLFGMGALSVRFPSLLFSCFTAVFIYRIGNKFFNSFTGIAAALIFTFSTMHVFFSHEARVYPLFAMLTATSLFYYLSICKAPQSTQVKQYYIVLFVANLVLIYSHYFGFFVLFTEAVCMLLLPNRKELFKSFFILFVCIGICYIPNLIIFWHRFSTSAQNGTWVSAPAITEFYGNLNRFINNRYNMLVLIVLGIIILISLYKSKTLIAKVKGLTRNQNYIIIFLWFIIPYTFMFLISFKVPMFIDRYILFTSVPFYILIAATLILLIEKMKYQLLAACVFVLSMIITVQLNPDNNRRLKELSDLVRSLKTNSSITLLAPDYAYMGFAYHYNIDYFKHASNTVADLNKEYIYPVNSTMQVKKILENTNASNCIYVQAGSEFSDPDNLIYSTIAEKYKYHKEYKVFQIYIIHQFYN